MLDVIETHPHETAIAGAGAEAFKRVAGVEHGGRVGNEAIKAHRHEACLFPVGEVLPFPGDHLAEPFGIESITSETVERWHPVDVDAPVTPKGGATITLVRKIQVKHRRVRGADVI